MTESVVVLRRGSAMVDPTVRILMLDDDEALVYHVRPAAVARVDFVTQSDLLDGATCPDDQYWFAPVADTTFEIITDDFVPERLLRLAPLGEIRSIDMDIVLLFVSHYAPSPIDDQVRRILSMAIIDGTVPPNALHHAIRLAFGRGWPAYAGTTLVLDAECTP
jgi:hypothetical protein